MPARVINVTVDCAETLKVATFWSAVLGRPLGDWSSADFASIGVGDLARTESAWFFERVPEGKIAKNRMHVDLVDPDPSAIERFVALGASVVGAHEIGDGLHRWTVLQDPEGNEFCVAEKVFSG